MAGPARGLGLDRSDGAAGGACADDVPGAVGMDAASWAVADGIFPGTPEAAAGGGIVGSAIWLSFRCKSREVVRMGVGSRPDSSRLFKLYRSLATDGVQPELATQDRPWSRRSWEL
jgi:hypothetical protein